MAVEAGAAVGDGCAVRPLGQKIWEGFLATTQSGRMVFLHRSRAYFGYLSYMPYLLPVSIADPR